MRIALAQIDSTLGEVEANLARIAGVVCDAERQGADLVVFPELAIHGYALGSIGADVAIAAGDPRLPALASGHADVVVGFHEDGGLRTHNTAAYLAAGAVAHVQRKLCLPTYLAWEERKHASPGQSLRAFDTRHGRAALLICNDAWQAPLPWLAAQDGAEILLVPANSAAGLGPPGFDPGAYWDPLLSGIARMQECWVVFVNRVGIEAGACFWGGSRVVDPEGRVVAQAPRDEPALTLVDVDVPAARRHRRALPLLAEGRLHLIEREVRRLIEQGGDA